MNGEEHGASPAQSRDESMRAVREGLGGSGWTTTKQAAKVLEVSRRSVQGYVGRGILEAREEGGGVNRRFLISIDSLNDLVVRRRREADDAANFAEASPQAEEAAKDIANTGEGLRHLVERLEARTAEATELWIRLEITERAQSSLEEERQKALEDLAEERQRREEAEAERDDLRRQLESHEDDPESPEIPGSRDDASTEAGEGPQEAEEDRRG